jgi:sulfur-carrier protein adenylyltransferase/sulfurtransferase
MSEIPADKDVYVHCRMGGRSARAVVYLRAFGRPNSYNVSGGIDAWQDAGLPVER